MVRGWSRYLAGWILFGLVVGAAAGVAAFYALRLDGVGRFALAGAVLGALGTVVARGYLRAVHLTEVVVMVPHVSELRFAVDRDARGTARRLFNQVVTRVSARHLPDDAGLLREALTSLHTLVTLIRDFTDAETSSPGQGGGPTVDSLAIGMINLELTPFLSHWHPALLRWERANPDADEREWPDNAACRRELALLQERLREYALGLATLAGLTNAAVLVATGEPIDAHPPAAEPVPAQRDR